MAFRIHLLIFALALVSCSQNDLPVAEMTSSREREARHRDAEVFVSWIPGVQTSQNVFSDDGECGVRFISTDFDRLNDTTFNLQAWSSYVTTNEFGDVHRMILTSPPETPVLTGSTKSTWTPAGNLFDGLVTYDGVEKVVWTRGDHRFGIRPARDNTSD